MHDTAAGAGHPEEREMASAPTPIAQNAAANSLQPSQHAEGAGMLSSPGQNVLEDNADVSLAPADVQTYATAQDLQVAASLLALNQSSPMITHPDTDQAAHFGSQLPPAQSEQSGAEVPTAEMRTEDASSPSRASTSAANGQAATPTPSSNDGTLPAPRLDVLLVPPAMNHRYVRGNDNSLIVERPERIHAVLLGIAAVMGRVQASTGSSKGQQREGSSSSLPDTAESLSKAMEQMGLAEDAVAPHTPVRILLSDRGLSLDPPEAAVAFVHAHEDEKVKLLQSAYEKDAAGASSPSGQEDAVADVKSELGEGSHAAYVQRLCRHAPSAPPTKRPVAKRGSRSSTSTPAKGGAAASVDGSDSDDDMHASEVPENLNQGDLYLCGGEAPDDMGGSGEAIRKSLGACAEAVDRVVRAATTRATSAPLNSLPAISADADAKATLDRMPPSKRCFLLTRPPGHHCTGSAPQGFCWVNNAVVAASHAYLEHGIDRVAVLDIDLHHGNGTQALAWRINADTQRKDLQRQAILATLQKSPAKGSKAKKAERSTATSLQDASVPPRGLKVFYGSIHDIESYPCENGDLELVQAASTCIAGSHGQWIWNTHLESYSDEKEFYAIYESKYATILRRARQFFLQTDASPENSLIIISAGFDACVHEYPSMQRHGKHVPPSFYHRFARDSVALADEVAHSKMISVLEGGYSDRALTSGALAHIAGLSADGDSDSAGDWWQTPHLVTLEKACKKLAMGTSSQTSKRRPESSPAWLQSTMHTFTALRRLLPGYVQPADHTAESTLPTAAGRTLRARNGRSTRPADESTGETSATPPSRGKVSTAPASEPMRKNWTSIREDSPLSTPTHGTLERRKQFSDSLDNEHSTSHAAEQGSSTPQERAAEEALAIQLDTMSLKAPQ